MIKYLHYYFFFRTKRFKGATNIYKSSLKNSPILLYPFEHAAFYYRSHNLTSL